MTWFQGGRRQCSACFPREPSVLSRDEASTQPTVLKTEMYQCYHNQHSHARFHVVSSLRLGVVSHPERSGGMIESRDERGLGRGQR